MELDLEVSLGDTNVPPLPAYGFPGDGFDLNRLPGWTIAPKPKPEEITNRRYDLIESVEKNYQIHLYRDFELVNDPVEALDAFRLKTSEAFLHGQSGWVFTLYRLSFVVDTKRYEMDLFTPPGNDPAKLPFVMETILGTLRRPEPPRPAEARPSSSFPPKIPSRPRPAGPRASTILPSWLTCSAHCD